MEPLSQTQAGPPAFIVPDASSSLILTRPPPLYARLPIIKNHNKAYQIHRGGEHRLEGSNMLAAAIDTIGGFSSSKAAGDLSTRNTLLATDLAALCQKESKVTAHHCRVWKKDTRIFKAAVKVSSDIAAAAVLEARTAGTPAPDVTRDDGHATAVPPRPHTLLEALVAPAEPEWDLPSNPGFDRLQEWRTSIPAGAPPREVEDDNGSIGDNHSEVDGAQTESTSVDCNMQGIAVSVLTVDSEAPLLPPLPV